MVSREGMVNNDIEGKRKITNEEEITKGVGEWKYVMC